MKEAQTALLLSPPINPLFGLGSFFFFYVFVVLLPLCISSLLCKCLKVMLLRLLWRHQAGALA